MLVQLCILSLSTSIVLLLVGCGGGDSASSHHVERALVVRVIDGDTLEAVFTDGATERVRLLAVDTPEKRNNKAYEYGNIVDTRCLDAWGALATQFAMAGLSRQTVTIILDPKSRKRDVYNRLLAYIEVDGQDFNALLVQRGYARVYTEGDSRREEEYLALQRQAQSAGRGLWQCR